MVLTTPPGFTVLVTSETENAISSDVPTSVFTSTQERQAELACGSCGKICKSKAGLVAHSKVHTQYDVNSLSKCSNTGDELTCRTCDRQFTSKRGLTQHKRHMHPVERNLEKLSCMKTAGSRWTEQESAALLRIATSLAPTCSSLRSLYCQLERDFPGRTACSIKTRLRALNWKAAQVNLPDDNCVPSPLPNDSLFRGEAQHTEWASKMVEVAVSQLKDSPEESLRSADLLAMAESFQKGAIDSRQLLSLLEMHAVSTFPHKWKLHTKGYARRVNATYKNRKQIRRANYASLQALYHRRRKDAATAVFNGTWKDAYMSTRGLPDNSHQYWQEILSAPSHDDNRPCRSVTPMDWSLIEPIHHDEVSSAIRQMGNTAPGLDKIRPAELKHYSSKALAGYFNLLLLSEGCPEHLCLSRITLVPKVPHPTCPSEFRPIAVSSSIIRCFHKIIADRWNSRLHLPSLQFAFLKRDGCMEATSTLHAILRHSCSTGSGLSVAFIDVAKAFDSVSHETIIRSAKAFGAPPPLTQYLTVSYQKAAAALSTSTIHCHRGVRQGDPLSPLLFIMAMDEILASSMPQLGYQFYDTLVDGFAYADDLIIMAENLPRLQEKLDAASVALGLAGMKINTKKTKLLDIRGAHKPYITAASEKPLLFQNELIKPLSPTDTLTYLGIPFTWKGKASVNHRLQLQESLSQIRKAPLKPQQRLELTRQHLIPKFTHTLVLGNAHRNTLKRMDNAIRQSLREWLRLPPDTPTAYFHTACSLGGLGVPCLSTTIPLYKKARVEKLLTTTCPVLRNVVSAGSFKPIINEINIPVRVHGTVVTDKEGAREAWHQHLLNSVDGRGLRDVANSPLSNSWLLRPERIFPRVFLRAIHLRCNLLRTKVRSARGDRSDQSVLCRGNCGQAESLAHILQSCWVTHDARCARHNRVAKELARRLRKLGYSVFEELRAPTSHSFIKPDLIVVHGTTACVIDVSIVGDGRMQSAWSEKIEKYSSEAHTTAITSVLSSMGKPVERVHHEPLILSFRGICYTKSAKALIRLGLPRHSISDLCLLTIIGSLRTYDTFMCGTWR